MKRLIVEFRDGYVNIPGDRMVKLELECGSFIEIYSKGELVGVFDIEIIQKAYISEKET